VQAAAFERDRESILQQSRAAGLVRLLAPGWDLESSRQSVHLARGHDWIDASAGIHPHVAGTADESAWRAVQALARDPVAVAVGETGLDYDRGFSPRDAQLANLRRHLRLAVDLDRPVVLHCRSRPREREAQDDLLREIRDVPGVRPLIHSFSGPVDYAEQMLESGAWISFSGLVFRAGEEPSGAVAALVPADRLLVETDAPYLSPPGAPRRRNEPRYVEITLRWLAERRGEDVEALSERVAANYDALFRG
jgi:TatD DNase family protein